MGAWHRAIVVVLCQLSAVSCGEPSAPAGTETSRQPSTAAGPVDVTQIITPAPPRSSPTRSGMESGAHADDGAAGLGLTIGTGSAGVVSASGAGRGGSSSSTANAGTAGSQKPTEPAAGATGGH